MITTHQLKAARALLDWTQKDLASASNLHVNVINNIERGISNPRQQTFEKLQRALEGEGIAFIGLRGVELTRRAVEVRECEGESFIQTLTDDLLSVLQEPDDIVLFALSDLRDFDEYDPAGGSRYRDAKAERGFAERVVTRAVPGFQPKDPDHFRLVAPDLLGGVDTVIYADRVAHIFWDAKIVLIVKNPDLADTQRRVFGVLWRAGEAPPIRSAA